MPDYDAIAVKVAAGLAKAGVAMTLRKTVQGAYDPATGTFAAGVSTDYAVTGLIQSRSVSQADSVGQRFFNGVLVQTDDQFVILEAGTVPAPEDLLTITGIAYTVVTVIPVRPGGVDLMYRVLARK